MLMERLKHLKSRKDARLVFKKNQSVAVHCLTNTCNFDGHIQNVSSSGIFISTEQQLPMGEEIAVSFTFPESGNCVKATGKVVRVTNSGIGIEIKVYFKEKDDICEAPLNSSKKVPKVIFLNSSGQAK
jgi:Tfp pilus assembly protein PilZ